LITATINPQDHYYGSPQNPINQQHETENLQLSIVMLNQEYRVSFIRRKQRSGRPSHRRQRRKAWFDGMAQGSARSLNIPGRKALQASKSTIHPDHKTKLATHSIPIGSFTDRPLLGALVGI
jgi:hypothetical protein